MTKAEEMTLEERIRRDGDRWRYIWLLEQENERRKVRQIVLRGSLILKFMLAAVIAVLSAGY